MKLFFLVSPGAIFLLTLVANGQTPEEKFDTVVSDFLKGFFQANPISATSIGMHDYDNQLDDMRPAAIDAELNRLIIFRKKLTDIDLKDLPRNKRIDLQMLSENIDEAIFGLRDVREFEWNPMTYTIALGNSFASLLYQEFAPLEQRIKNTVERAKQVPRFLEQAKANLKNPPKMHVETAIKQNIGNISMIKDELATAGKTVSPKLQSNIQAASGAAVTALEDFGKWLEHDLMLRATRATRLGKELFDKKLAYALKTSLTPGEILKRARAEKMRIHEEMYALAAPMFKEYYGEDPTRNDTLGVIKKVLAKIVLEHCKKEEMMDVIKKIMTEIEKFVMEKDLVTLDPSQPLVIRETPEYERGVSVASLEAPGPLEKNLKTFYNVTPIPDEWKPEQVESYLREYNNWSLRDLSIHEGIPGHYVQLYYANRYPSIIRSIFGSGSMIEGWAVYTEGMMIEQGYMKQNPKMKLINLKWYLRVVINAILDQSIHAGNMTEQEAMKLMMTEGFQEEREAAGKWRRANLTSAQLSTYFVGFQEIRDLRNEYQKKMGSKFNLKEFHQKFLGFGSPSVKYIHELMLEP